MGGALEELHRPQSTAVPFYEQHVGTTWTGLGFGIFKYFPLLVS